MQHTLCYSVIIQLLNFLKQEIRMDAMVAPEFRVQTLCHNLLLTGQVFALQYLLSEPIDFWMARSTK